MIEDIDPLVTVAVAIAVAVVPIPTNGVPPILMGCCILTSGTEVYPSPASVIEKCCIVLAIDTIAVAAAPARNSYCALALTI